MLCSEGVRMTELDFVRAIVDEHADKGRCVGPIIKVALTLDHLDLLTKGLATEVYAYLLHSYIEECDELAFGMCASHWLFLSHLLWRRARRDDNSPLLALAMQLVDAACQGADMDCKEIANMFAWRGALMN